MAEPPTTPSPDITISIGDTIGDTTTPQVKRKYRRSPRRGNTQSPVPHVNGEACTLAGVLSNQIMTFYEAENISDILKCYKTGVFPFHTWHATWKGMCPSCWLPFDRLATVARHKTVNGIVVHAACRSGPLPSCYTCGEPATFDSVHRKVRNRNAIRCHACACRLAGR